MRRARQEQASQSTPTVLRNTIHNWVHSSHQRRDSAWDNSKLPKSQPDFSEYMHNHSGEFLRQRKGETGRERKLQEKGEMNHSLSLRPKCAQAGWGLGQVTSFHFWSRLLGNMWEQTSKSILLNKMLAAKVWEMGNHCWEPQQLLAAELWKRKTFVQEQYQVLESEILDWLPAVPLKSSVFLGKGLTPLGPS